MIGRTAIQSSATIGKDRSCIKARSGVNWCQEYRNYHNSMTEKPPVRIANLLNNMVKTLVDAGIWSKMDMFMYYGVGNINDALKWWNNPSKNATLQTEENYPTLLPYDSLLGRCYKYTATIKGHLKTSFNPITNGVNFTKNDNCFFVYIPRVGAPGFNEGGLYDNTLGGVTLAVHLGSGQLTYNRDNCKNTISDTHGLTQFDGLFLLNRKNSSGFDIWRNGTKLLTKSVASLDIANMELYEFIINPTSLNTASPDSSHLAIGIGGSLTDIQINTLYETLRDTYSNVKTLKNNTTNAGVCLIFDDTYRSLSWKQADDYLYPKWGWQASFCLSRDVDAYIAYLTPLIAHGHEMMNHTVNHIDWQAYLQTHTVQEFYDTEIAPQQTEIYNALGVTPTAFGYAQVTGTNNDLNNYILSHSAITRIRSAIVSMDDISLCKIPLNNTNPVIWTLALDMVNNDINTILDLIDDAKNNNHIIVMTGHSIALNDNTYQNISLENMDKICERVVKNGMKFYKFSEIPI